MRASKTTIVAVFVLAASLFIAVLAPIASQPAFARSQTVRVSDFEIHQGEDGSSLAATTAPTAQPSASADEPGARRTRLRLVLGMLGQAWQWLVLAAIVFSGLSPRLRDVACKLGGGRLGTLSPYVVLLSVLLSILGAPIAFYRDYVVEHEFGLSNQDFWAWLSDSAKSVGVGIVIGMIVLNLVYWTVRRSPRHWWAYGAAVVVAFSVVIATLAPVLITPLFNKFEPLQNQELRGRVLGLAERGGVQVADVLQMDMSRQTNAANAYFIGIGPTTRIVLGDTLLAKFTEEEVLTVVAHEMGHQVHDDIWRNVGVGAVTFFAAFYLLYRVLDPLIRRFKASFGFSRLEDAASLPLALLLVGLLFFLSQPIENTWSRYIEHEADRYALELTHENEVYASALDKLGRLNVSDPDPPSWMEFTFYSHPSLKRRIEFARTYRPWQN